MVNIIVIDIGEFVNGDKSYLFFKPYEGYVLRSHANLGTPMQLIHGDWVGYINFDKFLLYTDIEEHQYILRYAMVTKQDLHYSDSDSNLADFDASLVEWVVNPAVIEQSTKTAVQPSKFELMAELIIEELKSSCPDIGLPKTNKGKYMLLLSEQYILEIDAIGVLDIEVNWVDAHAMKIPCSMINLALYEGTPESVRPIFVNNAITILKGFCNVPQG